MKMKLNNLINTKDVEFEKLIKEKFLEKEMKE